ncbi:MAG TPA: lysylphosphatidylglycerol synthase transmembrane domain-containing protein [Vicinamibacterales bacterium]|nr:lysylphosphatidylglycerol synthase transmembrane domain-containing protein [Vicinamibacterales bacterium]
MTIPRTDARVRTITVGIAVALAAVLLYFSLRGIQWREVGRIVAGASAPRLALVLGIASLALLLRAVRWHVLLKRPPEDGHRPLAVPAVFWATAAGYFGNNFLPARAGELVRTMMISARSGLELPYVLATALSERVSDAVVLVLIAATVLLTMPAPPGWLAGAIRPFGAAALIAAAAIALLPLFAAPLQSAVRGIPLPERFRTALSSALENALHGMRALHDPRRLVPFAALTAVIWTLDAAGVVVGASALGLDAPFPIAFLLIAALGLSSALPSTPGYVGIYQFVAVSVLTPFGFSRNDAIAYILVAQALNYAVIGFWGAIGLLRYRRERSTA